ncbi:MAG: GIY-YIG nuclease family protein [bacterium]|jgi:hypothetical protein
MTQRTALQRIEDIGFRCCGRWEAFGSDGIKITLNEHARSANALYAFVSNAEVLYIGKTTQQLRKRLYGYQKPRPTQATNIRGNAAIAAALAKDDLVDVYVLPDHGLLRFGGFHLNLAAGLEDSLINDLRPIWNKRFGREDAIRKAMNAKANVDA